MSAKLIWQHYRQALDKEYNVSKDNFYWEYMAHLLLLYDSIFQSINDNQCADWDVLITFCNDDPDSLPGGDGHTWEDIAWQKVISLGQGSGRSVLLRVHFGTYLIRLTKLFQVNIDNNYNADFKQFEIGSQDGWYTNNANAQCVTLFVTPFSH